MNPSSIDNAATGGNERSQRPGCLKDEVFLRKVGGDNDLPRFAAAVNLLDKL